VDENAERAAMLTATGFPYNVLTDCWVNRSTGRAISTRTLARHDTDWLARWITGR
jgi:hypothetical protein